MSTCRRLTLKVAYLHFYGFEKIGFENSTHHNFLLGSPIEWKIWTLVKINDRNMFLILVLS